MTGHGLRIELRNKTRIATFNTLSLNPVGSSHLLSSELEKYDISIAGLTETRWPGVGEYTVNGYTYLWSGCDKHRVQGVALALNKQAYSSLIEWFPISSRILKARFNHHHGKLTVIVSYAPTNLAKDNVKHGFFSAVADTIASVSRHDVTIALGDYNATVSSSTQSRAAWSGVIGPVSPTTLTTTVTDCYRCVPPMPSSSFLIQSTSLQCNPNRYNVLQGPKHICRQPMLWKSFDEFEPPAITV